LRTLASLEGEYTIDNRGTPGLNEEIVVAQGLPAKAARGLFEEACYTCSHCERVVVKNRERTRPRGYCKKCDHVICDECEAKYVASAHECVPYKAKVEEFLNALDAKPIII
jgi:hypothetical protein